MAAEQVTPHIVFISIQDEQLTDLVAFLGPSMSEGYLINRTFFQVRDLLPHGFVALHAGGIVGFASIQIDSKRTAKLQALAVHPNYRGQEIESKLIEMCQHAATKAQVEELLIVTSETELAAKNGFNDATPVSYTHLTLPTTPYV